MKTKPKTKDRDLESVLMWVAFHSGLGRITKRNWKRFYVMGRILETAYGEGRVKMEGRKPVDVPITPKEVYDNIGLIKIETQITQRGFERDCLLNLYDSFWREADEWLEDKS